MLATHQHSIKHYISLDFCSLYLIAKFNSNFLKQRNVIQSFVNEQCFEEQCFDNKKWKQFSSVIDRPMFHNVNKTFLSFGETRNMKFNRCFFKSFHQVMLASWKIDMCKDWKNHLSSAQSACDFQKVYLRSIPCCNKCQVNLFFFNDST